MDMIWEKIQSLAEENNGIFSTKDATDAGISRPMLKKYTDIGYLICLSHGIYALKDEIVDEYVLIQKRSQYPVFSHGTALYLWGMSDRTPHILDITVPQGCNMTKLMQMDILRCHYVKKEIYGLGITKTISPQGAEITLYDRERCICDIIKDRGSIDMQIYTQAVKEYFSGNVNTRKIIKYARAMNIEDRVRMYMEVLQ